MAAQVPEHCLVHRVSSLPLVAVGVGQLANIYQYTKTYPVVGTTLGIAESTAKYAYDKVDPLVHKFDGPIIAAERKACEYLDSLEARYPSITKTPEQLVEDSKQYYESTRVKAGIDKVIAVKDYGVDTAVAVKNFGVDKVTETKDLVLGTVNGVVVTGRGKIVDSVRYTMMVLNNFLDSAENLVDKYIVDPKTASTLPHNHDETSALSKVQHIYGKAYGAALSRALSQYNAARESTIQALSQLQSVMLLAEYAKARQEWAQQTVSSAQDQTSKLYHDLVARAQQYGKQPDALILDVTRQAALVVSALSERLAGFSVSYLPTTVSNPVQSAADHAKSVSATFAEVKSLADLKAETLRQARESVELIQGGLVNVFEYLIDRIPLDWVTSRRSRSSSTTDIQNGTIPANARVTKSRSR